MTSSWISVLAKQLLGTRRMKPPRRVRSRLGLHVEQLEDRLVPAPFIVMTVNDNGNNENPLIGSLRDAINRVNGGQNDAIEFNLGIGSHTVKVKTNPLVSIIKPVTIYPADGQSITITPDKDNPLPAGSAGFRFARLGADSADGSQILGLTIDNFPGDGIRLDNVRNVRIGFKMVGDVKTIGRMTITRNGLTPGDFLVTAGIHIMGAQATGNQVLASLIGTDSASQAGLGNKNGIVIRNGASANTVGRSGLSACPIIGGECNVISGNNSADAGVGIAIVGSDSNTVIGNLIGTNRTATQKLPNRIGVRIAGGASNTIGGIVDAPKGVIAFPANVISGNNSVGLAIDGVTAVENKVYGNFIGTDGTGKVPLGNKGSGISLMLSSKSKIGDPLAGGRNVISANGVHGIEVAGSTNNRIENNNIGYGPAREGPAVVKLPNTVNGINYDTTSTDNEVKSTEIHPAAGKETIHNPAGERSRNKVLDPNSLFGPDGYAIFNGTRVGVPVITSAVVTPNPRTGVDELTISGTLYHAPLSTYTLEFFGNTVANRQAERFLEPLRAGATTVTTDLSGFYRFNITFKTVYGGWVTATSTGMASDGFTSEVSDDVQVIGASRSFAAVGDRVWLDLNGNGLQDKDAFGQDEPGVAGVTVELYFADGGFVGRTTTDATGYFVFTNLLPGDYYLQFLPPAGYDFTLAYQGDSILDSDADPLDGATAVFSLIAGQVETTFDAGLVYLMEGAARRFRGPRRR